MIRIFLVAFLFITGFVQAQHKWSALEVEADTLLNNKEFARALEKYSKVLALKAKEKFTGPALTRYKRAVCYFYLDDLTKALADLNIFVAANPAFYEARLLRAFIYRELDQTDKQLEDINEVLAVDPLNVDLLKWRAGIMLEKGEYKSAREDLLQVKEVQTDEEVELYLGLVWYYLDDPHQALDHFNKAIELDGGYAPAYQYAGILSVEQEAFTLALTYFDLALRLEPDNHQLIFYKGMTLVEMGNTDEGCRLLNKAFYAGVDDAADYLMEFCYKVEE